MQPRVLQHDIAGEAEPLVLIPGGLTGWLSWVPHQERLADRRRVIRVQPIHNELGSAGEPGDPSYSVETARKSLVLTLDQLEIASADIAGWSLGAESALDLTVTHPERVRSLTLIEPGSIWLLAQLDRLEATVVDSTRFLADLACREVTQDDLARFLVLAGLAADPSTVREHPSWENWVNHRMALSWIGLLDHARPLSEVATVQCPTLLVKGTRTVPWESRVIDILAEKIVSSRLLVLDGDHACHIEDMARFLDELMSHLDSAGLPAV